MHPPSRLQQCVTTTMEISSSSENIHRDPRPSAAGSIDAFAHEGGRPQILVVDDIWENRNIVVRYLSRKGVECVEADGSGAALKLLAKESFDLILLDIMMPGMDGSEFMHVVRDKYSQSELPIIMVTAKTCSNDIASSLEKGANDYIVKPIDWKVALPRIMAQLNRKLDTDQKLRAFRKIEVEASELRERIVRSSESLVKQGQLLSQKLGANNPLGDREVLELLLTSVDARCDAMAVSHRLIAAFGDLSGVVAAPEEHLLRIEGATDQVHLVLKLVETAAHRMARARIINRCAIASWDDLLRYCKTVMAHRSTEQVRVLYLDRKNVLIADEAQGEGTVDHVPVYPREVVRRALELNASAVILVHNHPSGDPEPSEEDVAMTARIVEACATVGVAVHDHLVIGKNQDASLRAMNLM